ncbi:MAG: hypothetical protein IPM96_12580 [Ignavibacteria bacterium]|nr:hypothetical protein [Ignavibacteria bacterium]
MTETKVLFLWKADWKLINHLNSNLTKKGNIKTVFPKDLSQKNLIRHAKDADVMVGWRPDMDLLLSAKKLKLFINPGTGVRHQINNFRELRKTSKAILVNGHGHSYSTAQHAVAMLLSLMNRIITHHNRMKNGIWETSDDEDLYGSSIQLKNRNIGLLGYGAINRHVHRFLSGFDNKFNVLKFSWKDHDGKFPTPVKKFTSKQIHTFLKESDILIIAVPHTDLTEDRIKAKELKLLGKTGLLVNVARGMVVNENDLYAALKNNIIAGAALDVWYNYKPEKDKEGKMFPAAKPFGKLENVILSPHRAASPFEDISRWDEVIENIRKVSLGKKNYLNIVDLDKEY